jgi:hypothetical protein
VISLEHSDAAPSCGTKSERAVQLTRRALGQDVQVDDSRVSALAPFSSTNLPRIGERVKIAPYGTYDFERTGIVRHVIADEAKIHTESNSTIRVNLALLSHAPTILEQIKDFAENDVLKAVLRLVVGSLGVTMPLSEVARRSGAELTDVRVWHKRGWVPADRVQQIADILGLDAQNVRAKLKVDLVASLPERLRQRQAFGFVGAV